MADCFTMPNAAELVEELRLFDEHYTSEQCCETLFCGTLCKNGDCVVVKAADAIEQMSGKIEQLEADNAKLRYERDAAIGMFVSEFGTNLDDCKMNGRRCGNCDKTDGRVYTSDPPQVRCTITGEFHHYGDACCAAKKEKE